MTRNNLNSINTFLITTACLIIKVEKSKPAYIENPPTMNLGALEKTGVINTVISFNNESIFNYLAKDDTNPHHLFACLDNAIISIDLATRTGWAYSGLPNQQGYAEGIGTNARYHEPMSLAQVDKSIIVADTQNFCLRQIDRKTRNSSTFAGECQDYRLKDSEALVTREQLRLWSPQALLYDSSNGTLYLADGEIIYALSVSSTEVRKIFLNDEHRFTSFVLLKRPKFLIGTTADSIVSIEENNAVKVIAGKGLNYNNDSVAPGVTFDKPRSLVQLNKDSYLLIEYRAHRLRGLHLLVKKTYSFCTGKDGYRDSWMKNCELYQPASAVLVGNSLYIGERGTYGGGLRVITLADGWTDPPEKNKNGVAVLAVVGALMLIATVFIIITRWYSVKEEQENSIQKTNTSEFPQMNFVRFMSRDASYRQASSDAQANFYPLRFMSRDADGPLLPAQLNMAVNQPTYSEQQLAILKNRLDGIDEDIVIPEINIMSVSSQPTFNVENDKDFNSQIRGSMEDYSEESRSLGPTPTESHE